MEKFKHSVDKKTKKPSVDGFFSKSYRKVQLLQGRYHQR